MSYRVKKILFITHETSRTGAPLVLLNFLKWLKVNNSEIQITVLDLKEDVLKNDFKKVADNYFSIKGLDPNPNTFFQEFKHRISKKIQSSKSLIKPVEGLLNKLAKEEFEVIYANTIITLPIAQEIKAKSPISKLVLHVHELSTIINQCAPNFKENSSDIDLFIAVSKLVKKELIEFYGVQIEKIKVIYEFSEVNKKNLQKENNLFIVGGSGTVHWRKGSDLFIQVAYYIKKHYKNLNVKFEWIGRISLLEETIIKAELRKSGLENRVYFKGEKENPMIFFNEFDVFLLCSREDPFPLVAIEIGNMGKPIICFEGATGTQEVLEKGGGVVVPYLDIQSMAEEVVNYYKNDRKLKKEGEEAADLFSGFSADKICPLIFDTITSING